MSFVRAVRFSGPVNLHLEHNNLLGTDPGTWTLDIPRERFIEIVIKDLQYLKTRFREAQLM